jgi:hypothetical protein
MIGFIDKKGYANKEGTDQGLVYKNLDAFKSGKGICYIPELDGNIIAGSIAEEEMKASGEDYDLATTYTYKDFLLLSGGNKEMARMIFDDVDWQSPGALIDSDYYDIGIINCPVCNWMCDSTKTWHCPKCGAGI